MRSISTIIISLLVMAVFPVSAKGVNQSLWLVMPFASSISNCSKYGANMRQSLTAALVKGKENSQGILPDSIWSILEAANTGTENKEINSSIEESCAGVIEMYQNPKFATHFRQAIAAQVASSPALVCIIKQPEISNEIREAWLKAFHRNGFELSENAMNTGIENSRSYVENKMSKVDVSLSDCKKTIENFSIEKFDTKFGEKGINNFFSEKK